MIDLHNELNTKLYFYLFISSLSHQWMVRLEHWTITNRDKLFFGQDLCQGWCSEHLQAKKYIFSWTLQMINKKCSMLKKMLF